MSLPPALESEFELVEELPAGKVFHLYHVKDMRKGGADAVVRLLPEKFAADQSIVNRFHDFFARFNGIPNRRYIPSVYSVVGVAGKEVYVVEEYCSGVSLAQFVEKNRGSKTFIQDVTEILARVCEALHHAHQKTVTHLCVLPSDILIDDHDYSKVKMVGFGAQIFAEKGKIDCLSSESSRYVAPEVFKRGVFGPKADVYSLAVTIKELLPEFSQGSDILDKATSVTLKDRFTSVREFAATLKEPVFTGTADEPRPKVSKPAKAAKPKGGLHPVVKIITEPAQAEIWCNGKILGITTSSGFMIPWKSGNVIEIKKTGYSTETLDLTAPPDKADITVALTSSLTLYTNPWGASVKVNGVFVGETTYKGLTVPWDKGEIVIEKDGYNPEHLSHHTPPSDEDVSLELKPLTTNPLFLDRRRLQLLGYGLAGLFILLLMALLFGRSQNQDYDKQVSELQTQLKSKDSEIAKLAQTEKNLKIDFEKQLGDLRTQLKNKEADIGRYSQASQEQNRQNTDLQKQLSDLRSQVNTKDAEIQRLIHQNNDEQQLRNNIQRQLSEANSELIKRGDEVSRLKTALAQRQQFSPARQLNTSLNDELVSACYRGDERKVRDLLDRGADPNLQTQMRGRTPLIIAVENNHLGVVRTLLSLGANPLIRSKDAWTAEDYAKFLDRTNPEILELLRKYR